VAPTVTSIVVADPQLTQPGETSTTLTITFSEAVTGFTASDIQAPHGTVSNLSSADNIVWTATYTPSATPQASGSELITIGANSYTDTAGNLGSAGSSTGLTADYSASTSPINANLALGTVNVGTTGVERLVSVQHIRGTAFNDTLVGNADNNIILPGAGLNQIDGGAGQDTVSFAGLGAGVTVNLAAGTVGGAIEGKANPVQSPQMVDATTTAGSQSAPLVVALGEGRWLSVWYDNALAVGTPNANTTDLLGPIRAQLFDGNNKVGTEITVSTTVPEDWNVGAMPVISAEKLSNGNVVVGWAKDDDVRRTDGGFKQSEVAQAVVQVNASGLSVGATSIVSNTSFEGYKSAPTITALNDGGYLMAWYNFGYSNPGGALLARVFNADGTPRTAEFAVGTSRVEGSELNSPPLVATTLANGSVVLTWVSEENGTSTQSTEIVQSLVTIGSGSASASVQSMVNTTTASHQGLPVVVALTDGRYLTFWQDAVFDVSVGGAIRGQLFNSAGAKVGGEFVVSTNWPTENAAGNEMPRMSAVTLSNGNVALSWVVDDGVGASGVGNIAGNSTTEVAQSLLTVGVSGVTVGTQTMVNSTAAGNQSGPALVALSEGRYFIAWYDNAYGNPAGLVRGQFYKADGSKDGVEIQIGSQRVEGNDDLDMPALNLTVISGDRVVVGWIGESGDNPDGSQTAAMSVVVSRTALPSNVAGTVVNAEHLIGTDFADVLTGDGGANTIESGAGNDRVTGTAGADVIRLGDGDDTFVFNNTVNAPVNLDGGAGTDRILVNGTGLHIDFSGLNWQAGTTNGVRNIEMIELGAEGANQLTVRAQDVLNLSSTTDVLRVLGNSNDQVNASGFATTGATQTVDGHTYVLYTHAAAPGAQLLVEQAVHVVL